MDVCELLHKGNHVGPQNIFLGHNICDNWCLYGSMAMVGSHCMTVHDLWYQLITSVDYGWFVCQDDPAFWTERVSLFACVWVPIETNMYIRLQIIPSFTEWWYYFRTLDILKLHIWVIFGVTYPHFFLVLILCEPFPIFVKHYHFVG